MGARHHHGQSPLLALPWPILIFRRRPGCAYIFAPAAEWRQAATCWRRQADCLYRAIIIRLQTMMIHEGTPARQFASGRPFLWPAGRPPHAAAAAQTRTTGE